MFDEEGYELRTISKRLKAMGLTLVKRAEKSTECVEGSYLVEVADKILMMAETGDNK